MILHFLSHWRYDSDLSGVHGRMTSGRFHRKGTDCIYGYENRVLAVMENHGYKTAEDVPETLKIVEISVPEKSILELLPKDIPGWRDKPHNEQVRDYVDGLLKKREWFLIKLPSTEMPGEFLHIINTRHPLMAEVEILGKADSSYPD